MTTARLVRPEAVLDYCRTARLPFGIFLADMIGRHVRTHRSDPLALAADIQKELVVIDLIRRDAEVGGPYTEIVVPERLGNLATLDTYQLIAPPGAALERFRSGFLANPSIDLSELWDRATHFQNNNLVPASVPPLGRIYTSDSTGLGSGSAALVSAVALNAALLVQAACRALVAPADRARMSIAKIYVTDPAPLRRAQERANRLLVHKRRPGTQERLEIRQSLQIAIGWLLEAGFPDYAACVSAFLDDPSAPLGPHRNG